LKLTYGIFKFAHHIHGMKLRLARRSYKEFGDDELVLAFKRTEDKSIIGEFYSRYSHLILGCCLKYLKQFENAEDATMKVFEELGRKLMKHEVQHFKSWLYMVTKNECLQQLRKKGLNTSEFGLENISDEENDTEHLELTEARLGSLHLALQDLKGIQKECVELFYISQKSYVEISNELEIPLNTVKSAIQNGKRNLKLWFDKHEK